MFSRTVIFCVIVALLPACAGVSEQPPAEVTEKLAASRQLLNDALFAGDESEQDRSVEHFLYLPAEIRQQLDQTVLPIKSEEQRFKALRNWAFAEFQVNYEYDPSFTSPLGELEDNKRINCFSFSNMFVAAARYANISAHFQLVDSPPQWNIDKDTLLVSQHINVTGRVTRRLSESERRYLREQQRETGTRIRRAPAFNVNRAYVVDLNPEIAADSYRSTEITDREALSLFYSNRSIEALFRGEMDAARRFGKLAILADDKSGTAWNNLGVLLSRGGKPEEAKQAYITALVLDPTGESSANNLESVYRRLGEVEKADAMAQRIMANRIKNPYYHYSMGERMLASGDIEDAEEHFEDAIQRKDDERLFYYALAETQIGLAEYTQATKNLEVAKKYSTRKDMWRYDQLSSQLQSAAQEG
jgi:tetratricopeptide (TPR) repeat protein